MYVMGGQRWVFLGFSRVLSLYKDIREQGRHKKVPVPSHAFVGWFFLYIHLLSAGSLISCTLKDLGMWLDPGALH